jgi:hypothetical protein
MEEGIVTSLAKEFNVKEDIVRLAVDEANGEIDGARKIILELMPRYLAIKARFISGRRTNAGLIFILTEKGRSDFVLFRVIFETDLEFISSIPLSLPSVDFFDEIRQYFNEHSAGFKVYDSQKLRTGISKKLSGTALNYLFDLWDEPEIQVISENEPDGSYNQVGPILTQLLEAIIGEIIVDRANVELSYEFISESDFQANSGRFGLENESVDKKDSKGESTASAGLQVYLVGRFVIDPVEGSLVKEIEVGEKAYVEILDRSDVAVTIGRLIGAYKLGFWRPIRATVVDIAPLTGERRKVRLKVAKGIYVNVLSFNDILVRTKRTVRSEIPLPEKAVPDILGIFPILIGLVVIVGIILLLTVVF